MSESTLRTEQKMDEKYATIKRKCIIKKIKRKIFKICYLLLKKNKDQLEIAHIETALSSSVSSSVRKTLHMGIWKAYLQENFIL